MNKFFSYLLTAFYLTLTACGGSESSQNIFEELENKQGRASLSRTPDSVLGYWALDGFDDQLNKIETDKFTMALKCPDEDYVGEDFRGKVDQVSIPIQLISETGKLGIMIISKSSDVYYFCGTTEMTSDLSIEKLNKGDLSRFLVEGFKVYWSDGDEEVDRNNYLEKVSDL